ncbi:hypothetical protein J6590_016702 [Homalodisca vitripennis]|nr:hypothetical protein J6590_016702 [Homalodisca vitripennis]
MKKKATYCTKRTKNMGLDTADVEVITLASASWLDFAAVIGKVKILRLEEKSREVVIIDLKLKSETRLNSFKTKSRR